MASHRKTPSTGYAFGAACWGLTLTVCAIGAVLMAGTVTGGSRDYGLLVGAAALAAAGCLVRRLCFASAREIDRGAYRRQFAQQPVRGASSHLVEITELGAAPGWEGTARRR